MLYIAKETDAQLKQTEQAAPVREQLQVVLDGLGFRLIELTIARHRGSVQVRAVIYNGASIGIDDCSKVHRAITPRLEVAFPQQDIYIEVSSPGVNRLIREGTEFAWYKGRGVRCYRTDISDWTAGILEDADEKGISLKTTGGVLRMSFDIIAKAKLDPSQEV